MAIINNIACQITLKHFKSTQKRIDKLTKKLNKLSKAADECVEAFKKFKQYWPFEIEVEKIDGGKNE